MGFPFWPNILVYFTMSSSHVVMMWCLRVILIRKKKTIGPMCQPAESAWDPYGPPHVNNKPLFTPIYLPAEPGHGRRREGQQQVASDGKRDELAPGGLLPRCGQWPPSPSSLSFPKYGGWQSLSSILPTWHPTEWAAR